MAPRTTLNQPPAIHTHSLTYTPPSSPNPTLTNITLSLPSQSRTLLLGANGSGKTTLLRLLSGSRLSPPGTISMMGVDPFTTGLEGVTYLGCEWVLNPIVRTDIGVAELLKSMGGDIWPTRCEELVRLLDIDISWRLHAVSDGERRRVQLAMGLLRPWKVLLLDEVTVDLDLLSRSELLGWLKRETEARGATVVYATHILDGLDGWGTHLVHMHEGTVREWGEVGRWINPEVDEARRDGGEVDGEEGRNGDVVHGDKQRGNRVREGRGRGMLGELVLGWLRQDLKDRGPRKGGEGGQGKTYESLEGKGGYGFESKRG